MHYKSICDAILSRIRAAINSETFLNQFKEPNRFTRKRLISMYQVIVYLFYSNKAAMGTNISNIRDFLPELDFPKVSRQAVSKARQNIKPALFKELLDITVRTYYLFTQIFNLWNGYHLFNFLVDAGCSCLMRIKKSTTSLTGSEEDDIVLDSAKYHANIRVVQVELSTLLLHYQK